MSFGMRAPKPTTPALAEEMSATTIEAPSRANSCAVDRPIPDPAPVMMATFPFTCIARSFVR